MSSPVAYFYFDFRDIDKQHWHHLITSILTQLSLNSSPCCDILLCLHSELDNGAQEPGDDTEIDTLDECPNTSGIPSHRNRVLWLMKELIDLHLPNLHICITSRPEVVPSIPMYGPMPRKRLYLEGSR